MKIEQLERWLKVSTPGDRCVYHTGLLMADRQVDGVLDELAKRVWWEAVFTRRVELVQRRVGGECEYVMIKRGGWR